MREIQVEESTYKRLQDHARPFEDNNPEDVIKRALDILEGLKRTTVPEKTGRSERHVDLLRLPNLKHTKVISARVNGREIPRPKWNPLLEDLVVFVMTDLAVSFERLEQICPANMVRGQKDDDGYTHLSKIGLSIQRQDASGACHAIVTMAQELRISLEIRFRWRRRDGAAYPGEYGVIALNAPLDGSRPAEKV